VGRVCCQQPCFEDIRGRRWTARRLECRRYSGGACGLCHRFANLVTEPVGAQAFGGQSCPCASNLNASSHFQLVSPEWNRTDWNPSRKCFLGCSHACMRHRTDRAIEQWPVRNEPFDPSVGGNLELGEVTSWERGHDRDGLAREGLQCDFNQAAVILKLG
jgi:hypothetical protein